MRRNRDVARRSAMPHAAPFRRSGGTKTPLTPWDDHVPASGYVSRDDRQAHRQGFQQHQRHPFPLRRQDEDVRVAV